MARKGLFLELSASTHAFSFNKSSIIELLLLRLASFPASSDAVVEQALVFLCAGGDVVDQN